jgi:Homing endonuclease associated repeat/HNH endonuclease
VDEFKLKPWNRGITDQELLDDLRRVAKLLGMATLKYDEYPTHGRCTSRIFETRFGSWNAALLAAGLLVGRRQNISDLELFENMEKVWTLVGRQPRRDDMKKPTSAFSKGTYERRFGGWRQSLEKFVAFANGTLQEPVFRSSAAPDRSPRFPDLRMRWRVLNRDSFRCRSCGRSPAIGHGVILHVDHIRAWSKGGTTNDENLQTLCDRCNLGKGDV